MSPRRRSSSLLVNRYLSLIAGAVFSAGAGGSAGVAPSFCACALVVAGGRFIG